MNKLYAPNGKPSNLTPEQYKLVRTPEFKAWFGDWENDPNDNMLIDKNGEPMIWFHTGGDWTKLNDDGINGKGKLMFSPTKSSMAYGRDGKQTITRPFFIKSDFIYMLPYEDRDTSSAYRWNKNKKNPIWFVNAYGGFIVVRQSNQIKLADGTNTTFDGKNPDIRFGEGGYTEWNLDRYRQVEKEMFELIKQGKGDTLEYFKLIKERSILEQAKMNPSSNTNNTFAKGGKIIAYKNEKEKFNKIGVTDKYVIEAITEIGLQGINFDSKSINVRIRLEFEKLLKQANTKEYLINEDSVAISNVINNEITTKTLAGATDDTIDDLKLALESKTRRKKEYIYVFANTQKESINEWVNYLKQSEYPVAIKYLLLKAVLNFNYDYKINDLKTRTPSTIRNFTPFDAGSLSELIALNSDILLQDYVEIQVSNAIKILRSKELLETSEGGTWIKFDGGSKTSEEIKSQNAVDLSKMVQNTYWCTKTNAKSQLDGGDFYIYATTLNDEVFPRIAIRMEEDKVGELRGNQSSAQDLEIEMLPIAKDFLLNNLDAQSGKKWLDSIDYNNSAIELNEKLTKNGLFKNSVEEFIELKSKENQNLLDYADRNGHIVRIEKLVNDLIKKPNKFYKPKEVVIDLNDFDNLKTKIIINDADFRDSQIKDLGQLTTIGGDADFRNSQIKDLGQLTSIGGYANFRDSQIQDLGKLTTIGGSANFQDSKVENLGQLTTIVGYADFENSKIQDLGKLTTIDGSAFFENSKVENLGQLTTIGGTAFFENSKVENLGQLTTIGRGAYFGGRTDLEAEWEKIQLKKKNKFMSGGSVRKNTNTTFAKGGKIIAYKNEKEKFNKIGVSDKYVIEAITEIGLQGINFDSKSINVRIRLEFEKLLKQANTNEYLINEDSVAISNVINNEITTKTLAGATDDTIDDLKLSLENKTRRKEEYIDVFANTQKESINEWVSYLKESEYTDAIKYLLLKAVLNYNYDYKTNELKTRTPSTIRNFTPFDAGSLSELIALNSDILLQDYVEIQVSNAIKILRSKELLKTSEGGTWIKFDGGSKTSEEIKSQNAVDLSKMVQNTYWCTKTNAKSQLDDGDFYIYATTLNDEVFPRIAIRMEEDKVGELRGNQSSAQDLEIEMLPIAKDFLLNNLDAQSGKKWLDSIDYNNSAIELNEKLTKNGLFKNSVEEFIELKSKENQNLLDYADRNGHIVRIEKLINDLIKKPNKFYKPKEVVIDLNDFDNLKTKIIIGDAYFSYSQIKDLGQLTTIGGSANFKHSQIENLGQLTTIVGTAFFENSKVENLGQLTTIGGTAFFENSKVENLGQLTTIVGSAYFSNSQIKDLGQLTTIGGSANFRDSQIKDLGKLTTIVGVADFRISKVENLGKLTTIGGDANFYDSKVENLGKLTTIGGYADFRNSQVQNLGQLTTIGGSANFRDSQIKDLGQLTTIVGSANFINSQVQNLGQLTTIGRYADFRNSKVQDLGQLTTIVGDAYFENSKIQDLGQLTTIGGNADFENSQIKDLGQLTTIGGYAYFENSQVQNLGQLTTIGGNVYFENSQVENLGQLTTIGGLAYFRNSQVQDLGQLTTIGGSANFGNSQVQNLGQLTTIGGYAYFENSKIQDLGQLTTIGRYAYFKDRTDLEAEWKKIKYPKKVETIDSKYAKGGKVVVLPADIQKYKKIGIEDKYFIEASKDVGLQGINFDSKSLLKRIESKFNDMLDNYQSYLINEDSPSITNYINNEIEINKEQGSSIEIIQRLEEKLDNSTLRRQEIDDIAKTQNESLEKWVNYLPLSEYNLPFKFLILKAVLNFNYDLKLDKLFERGRDTIRNFTPFDAGSLAELNEKDSDYLLLDYSIIMNENSIKILKSQEIVQQSENGKWIKFNGGRKTKPEDIEKNGNRLMNLVQNTYWCTKSTGTSQLKGGDFYVYVTELNGEIFPRIAVRMNEDEVGEVRGNKSSAQDLDAEMLPIAEEFLLKNIPNSSGKKWLNSITYNKKCVEMRERFEAEGMYKDFIYDYIKLIADKEKYRVDYGANGNVTLLEQKFEEIIQVPNEYYQKDDIVTDYRFLSPNTIYYIGNLGRYEFSYIQSNRENGNNEIRDLSNWKLKLISGYFETHPNMSNLGNVEFVGNNLVINENIKDLGEIKYIGNELNIIGVSLESLNNLESIGGGLIIKRNIKDLGKLKKVGFLQIYGCDDNFTLGSLEEIEGDLNIEALDKDIDFGKLKKIGGSLFAGKSMVTNLKELESVGNNFSIFGSKIKLFPNLKTIGGNADFSNNFCSSTQNIETILGDIKFLNSRIMEFPKLNKINGTIEFRGSYFKSLGNIKYIGGSLNFSESKLEELGELDYVGGYVSFKGSNIKSLNKLKKVVGFANFDFSQVEDLGDLESIGGNMYLLNTKIKSLGKLNYVGGLVMMKKDNYKFSDNSDLISEQLKK